MKLTMADIPTIEDSGSLGRGPLSETMLDEQYSGSGAHPLQGMVTSLGLTLGLQAASLVRERLIPGIDQILGVNAAGPSYTQYLNCGYHQIPGTTQPCIGAPPHYMDPYYCATCAEQSTEPVNNPPYNWHYTGARGSITYGDYYNVCSGPQGAKDAWKWDIGPTSGCSQKTIYRCHDGWKKYPNDTAVTFTICKGLVQCDNKLTTCP